MHSLSSRIAALVARWELPGRRYWLDRAGVLDNARWTGHGHANCKGRWHGYTLRLNLADYHQRGAYFHARLFDLAVQVFLLRALRPGDEYLDLGANIGLTTLIGAHAVGRAGSVTAVEPNPTVAAELRAHIDLNHLSWVRIIEAGFSDRVDTLTLSIPPTGNTGAGTLGSLPPRHKGKVSVAHSVPVVRGDTHIAPSGPPLTIKIDVEGHESAALRGLDPVIRARKPAIIAEINPEMLARSHSSAAELLGLFRAWGYDLFLPEASARALRRRERFRLIPVSEAWVPTRLVNAVALAPGTAHHQRLIDTIAARAAHAPPMSPPEHAD